MTIGQITDFLLKNYYSRFNPEDMPMPTEEQLINVLYDNSDKLVVVSDGIDIACVAVFLKLTDETFRDIKSIDMTNVDILSSLLKEDGDNLHFILLAANGMKYIRQGMREVKRTLRPKTVSWYNPTMTRIHRYSCN